MQRILSQYAWNKDKLHSLYQKRLADKLSQPGGMVNIDSSEIVKKGKESAGATNQYCNQLGKLARFRVVTPGMNFLTRNAGLSSGKDPMAN